MDGTAEVAGPSAGGRGLRGRGQEIGGRCSGADSAPGRTGLAVAVRLIGWATGSRSAVEPPVNPGSAEGHCTMEQAFWGASGCGCCPSSSASFIAMSPQGIDVTAGCGSQFACTGPASATLSMINISKQRRTAFSISVDVMLRSGFSNGRVELPPTRPDPLPRSSVPKAFCRPSAKACVPIDTQNIRARRSEGYAAHRAVTSSRSFSIATCSLSL